MPRLGHGKAAGQVERHDVRQVALVVHAGAQRLHGTAEQPPLHAGLYQQRQVGEPEHLERRELATDVVSPAECLLEPEALATLPRERVGLGDDAGPVLLRAERGHRLKPLRANVVTHRLADVPPSSVENTAQRLGIYGTHDAHTLPSSSLAKLRDNGASL